MPSAPAVVEVVRSGFVECRHRGRVVAVDPDGTLAWAVGDPHAPLYPRSSNKPLQATAMVRAGLDVPADLLALASASHSGEPFHVAGVRRLLATAGLDEKALRCPPAWPLDEQAKLDLARSGGGPEPVAMNCSGKHAGMLATCVAAGWPVAGYVDPAHPLQRHIRETVAELAGEAVAHVGVDGCGAPLFALSLAGLARAFRALALAPEGTAAARVAAAVRAHPEHTSGSRRQEAALVRGVPGLLAKSGAEACYAAALPDGRAVALKIEDGGERARSVVMAAALRRLGVPEEQLAGQLTAPVLGGGRPVGEVRATPEVRGA